VVQYLRVCAFAVLLLLLFGCATRVTIEMDDKIPPTFKFKRNFDEVYFIPVFLYPRSIPRTSTFRGLRRRKRTR